MKPKRRILLYVAALIPDALAWLMLLLLRPLWGKKLFWDKNVLVLEARGDSFLVRRVFGGYTQGLGMHGWGATTIAPHAIIMNEGQHLVLGHEHVHVEQFEAAAIVSLFMTAVAFAARVDWPFALAPVALGPWSIMGGAYVAAFLRGEPIYTGAHIEEAAYSQHPHEGHDG